MTLKSNFDLHHYLDNMQTFVVILDINGILIFANQSPMFQAGITESDIINKPFWNCPWFEYDRFLKDLIKQDCLICASGGTVKREIQISINNELVWIDFSIHPAFETNGKVSQLVAEAQLITKQKQTAALLDDSNRKSHAWLENSPVCTKIVDLNFNLKYMSSAGVESLKIKDICEFYSTPYPFDFYPTDFKIKMNNCLQKVVSTKSKQKLEAAVVDIHSNEIWFYSTLVPVLNNNNDIDYIIIVSIDISEQKHAEQELLQLNKELEARVIQRTKQLELANQQLKHISETDPLTQIANRRVYERKLSENIALAKRAKQHMSLLMIDIDHFKEYNDHYGHDFGDKALATVAKTIEKSLSREVDFTARFGGEEFVVLLPSTNEKGAFEVAETIRQNINKLKVKHEFSSCSKILTVSIGIASLKAEEINGDKLLKIADTALYYSKSNGRNQINSKYKNAS